MILNRQQKEALVIELLNKGVTVPEIAKQVHLNFTDIKKIREKVTGDDKSIEEENKNKTRSKTSRAFELFLDGKSTVKAAIELNLEPQEAMDIFNSYLRLQHMNDIVNLLKEHKNQWHSFVKLFDELKKNNTRVKDIRYALDNVNNIKALEQRRDELMEEIQSLSCQRDLLLANIEETKRGYY